MAIWRGALLREIVEPGRGKLWTKWQEASKYHEGDEDVFLSSSGDLPLGEARNGRCLWNASMMAGSRTPLLQVANGTVHDSGHGRSLSLGDYHAAVGFV
jgi:hypothetical protein